MFIVKLLRILFGKINSLWLRSLSNEAYARKIGVKIGKRCSIGSRFWGTEPYLIEIGDHVQITSGVRFFTHGGGHVFREEYPDMDFFGKIKIGRNVYIGNGAYVLPGVSIGDNVVVGAGSVVTKSVPSGAIIAGNPARIVSSFDEFKKKTLAHNVGTKSMAPEDKKTYLLSGKADEFFVKKGYLK